MSASVIAIASDHGGYELKTVLKEVIAAAGCEVLDLGAHDEASVDYPDFANALAKTIREGKASRGVLLCGTGIGMSIAANRHVELRAALVHDAFGARLCRAHNDANVLCMGGRSIGPEVAKDCLRIFLSTEFEGGRHARRVEKLNVCR
jgi:ribose 5-phosphate isomerase B